ncbi:hypothetical protein [Lactococcus muris]
MNYITMEISYLNIHRNLLFLDSHVEKTLPFEKVEVLSNQSLFKKK